MAIFDRSIYTWKQNGTDKERLFCKTFEEYVNKLHSYLYNASTFEVNSQDKKVHVTITRSSMMKNLLPYCLFPKEHETRPETETIRMIYETRHSSGESDIGIIHPKLHTKLTTQQALDALNPLGITQL